MRYRFSNIKWASRFYEGKRGQSLVEFALMLPFLVLLVVGTIDLGRAYFSFVSITNAAREGARYAAAKPPLNATYISAIKDRAKGEVDSNLINVSNLIVTPTCNASCGRKDTVVVTVSYPFQTFTGVVFDIRTFQLTAKDEMEIFAGQ